MIAKFGSHRPAANMCSSRLKRSFRIEDILNRPKTNGGTHTTAEKHVNNDHLKTNQEALDRIKSAAKPETNGDRTKTVIQANEKYQHKKREPAYTPIEVPLNDTNFRLPPLHLEDRAYPTMPLIPTPIKPDMSWACDSMLKPMYPQVDPRGRYNFYNELPSPEQALFLRNNYLSRRFTVPPMMASPYGFDRGLPGYWASCLGFLPGLAKRKGGQVRFTTQQTNTLERRFAGNKYLSPEDRRLLAQQLKLSDRQVKTWFQNRRAKWRRTNTNGEKTDTEVEDISDDEEDLSDHKADSV